MPRGRASEPLEESIETVLAATEEAVRAATPGLHVERKWNHDWRAGTNLVVCVGAYSHHVGVEFWRGASLPDPSGLLEGTGKNLRHVKVRSVVEARARALRELVRAAAALDARAEKPQHVAPGSTRARRR